MIDLLLEPDKIVSERVSSVILRLVNTGYSAYTNINLSIRPSSQVILVQGSKELRRDHLDADTVFNHKLEIKLVQEGYHQINITNYSYRSPNGEVIRLPNTSLLLTGIPAPINIVQTPPPATSNKHYLQHEKIIDSRNALARLRNMLAYFYQDSHDIRRIVDDSGIDQTHINFNLSARNIWREVLIVAEKIGQVDALLVVVEGEYGANDKFRNACDLFRLSSG